MIFIWYSPYGMNYGNMPDTVISICTHAHVYTVRHR